LNGSCAAQMSCSGLCQLSWRYIMPLTFCRNRRIIRRKHSRQPFRRLENTSVTLISDMLTHWFLLTLSYCDIWK